MQVIKTMPPGAPGTRKYTEEWHEQLVAVRYRQDDIQRRILTTIEIIVDQRPLRKAFPAHNPKLSREMQVVNIQIDYREKDLRTKVKAAGGRWLPHLGAWALPYREVKMLGLLGRIM